MAFKVGHVENQVDFDAQQENLLPRTSQHAGHTWDALDCILLAIPVIGWIALIFRHCVFGQSHRSGSSLESKTVTYNQSREIIEGKCKKAKLLCSNFHSLLGGANNKLWVDNYLLAKEWLKNNSELSAEVQYDLLNKYVKGWEHVYELKKHS